MATTNITPNIRESGVVHPLDDIREKQRTSEGLGTIRMTRAVRISL